MLRSTTIALLMLILVGCATTGDLEENKQEASFSFKELSAAEVVSLPLVSFLKADDGIELAYREYLPEHIEALLLFYHGGGAHSAAGYEYIGSRLSQDFEIAVITPDLRGHGASGGERGDTPSVEQIYKDMSKLIQLIRQKFPDKALFLGGHSSGGGLVLNYSSFELKEDVDGYVFVSPQYGFRSGIERVDNPNPFAIVKEIYFIENARFGKYGNTHAVLFNYPESVLEEDPLLLKSITVNMAKATTPDSPAEQLQFIDIPAATWVGKNDELLDAVKLIEFTQKNNPSFYTGIIPETNHLSVILNISDHLGRWISSQI